MKCEVCGLGLASSVEGVKAHYTYRHDSITHARPLASHLARLVLPGLGVEPNHISKRTKAQIVEDMETKHLNAHLIQTSDPDVSKYQNTIIIEPRARQGPSWASYEYLATPDCTPQDHVCALCFQTKLDNLVISSEEAVTYLSQQTGGNYNV